jgi:glycosyltransferase involved in cell wall biosynthesis
VWTLLRRLRLTLKRQPRYYRPPTSSLVRLGGAVDRMVHETWTATAASARASLDQALAFRADVLFAHDAPTAELALARRAPGQQVWLLLHTPMPQPLYLAWSWGVPERPWEEIRAFPDVQAWTTREAQVLQAVDRLVIPSREAAAELPRAQAKYERPLARAHYLLTGAAAPSRALATLDRPRLRGQFGLPAGVPVGLFLGNAQPYRGLDLLVAALDRLPPRRARPGVVAVAGCPADSLPFHPRLLALGFVSDVADLLAAVDFVINVNRFSLFDLSTIEALEASRPLLVSPVGGNLTFRNLGAGAVTLHELTPAAIAEGLSEMFALGDEGRRELSERSRRCYDDHLTLGHLRDRHVAMYDEAALYDVKPSGPQALRPS